MPDEYEYDGDTGRTFINGQWVGKGDSSYSSTIDKSAKTEAQELTETFTTQLNNFHLLADYLKFCEVLGFTPDDYAEEKYRQFQELVSALNQFDVESLAKMLEASK
ncbi:hypothetical protein [Fischerella sp. PCC 9605]|uniref:hypothetical protein n=1 Tax=Fischerella sp. PCC 9605 TaxID=1173024 RepID=UPI0004BBE498|nr:hypothetical protein [Fischerella sp. PCC 9605]